MNKSRVREELIREAERLRKNEINRTLERLKDVEAERKFAEALRDNQRARVEQLDNQELKQYRLEHERIKGDLSNAGYGDHSAGGAKLRLRQVELEKLAEKVVNRRPAEVFRGVKGKFKVGIDGMPKEVMYTNADGPDLNALTEELLKEVDDKKKIEEKLLNLLPKMKGTMRNVVMNELMTNIRNAAARARDRVEQRKINEAAQKIQRVFSDYKARGMQSAKEAAFEKKMSSFTERAREEDARRFLYK